ncbi:MAG: glycosyl hydrolase [Planctomycetota bacterium]
MQHLHLALFVLLIQGLCAVAFTGRAALGSWENGFAMPPSDARILKIIHNWPDKPAAQDKYINQFRTQGFGGVVCNVSFDQYLESDAKWLAFVRAVNEARKAGFAMWLYDERGYPSGNAGGITLRDHPEWEARGLLVIDTESQGGLVTLELPAGKLVLAGAFEVHDGNIDITKKIDLADQVCDGRLNWQVPAGRWHVMAITESRLYEGTHAEGNLHAKIPYINLLIPEPTARFIDVTYGGYTKYLGGDLGKYFMATFTDEPSLMSLFLRPMPYRPLPWASNLPIEFRKRRGYTLDAAILPALVVDAGSSGAKIRYDFWLTIGELVSENFFGQIQTYCCQYGVPSGGHLLAEEGIVGHVPLYGDFFRCIRRLDAPGIDCLTSVPPEVPWFIARLLSSAAELEGRSLVMSETSDHGQRYRPAGDQRPRRVVTESEIRGTCNRLIVAGINCITSYYSFADLSDEQLCRINEWVGRCCTALRGGHQVADIAVLYPTESLWTRFVPSRHWTREAAAAARIESLYRAAAESLFGSQRDFTFIDSRALREATAESSTLVHGRFRWRVVVLPGVDTLPLAAWENLTRFVRRGGAVIALGSLPANSESEFPSARVQTLAKEIFGENGEYSTSIHEPQSHVNAAGGSGIYLPFGLESLLPIVLDGLLEPDVKVAKAKSPLRVTHHRLDDREVYFVINDGAKPWSGQVDFAAAGSGERWNPATGKREETLTGSTARVSLEPYGAAFFCFTSAKPPRRRNITSGELPNLALSTTPEVEPSMGHGEFVRAELSPDVAHSRAGSPAWQAAAVLTRGKVDTHLFLQFHYSQPLDLSEADCIAIETWVPVGQSTPSRLLVILNEEGGGDFIAETGRSLTVTGRERTFVALSRFQLAGWSKDADGILDLKRLSDIRIGWGGYFGVEHEKVQFSVAIPQVGAVISNYE